MVFENIECGVEGGEILTFRRHSHFRLYYYFSGVIPMVFEPNIVTPTTAAGARAATERTPLGPRGNHICTT